MADLLDFGGVRVLTSNAAPGAGYVARFYASGTTTPVTVYTDSALGTALGTYVTADSAGRVAAAWSTGGAIKCVWEDASGAVVDTIDPVISVSGTLSGASDVSFDPTVELPFTNVQDAIVGAAESAASGYAVFGIGITGNATLLAALDATNIGAGTYRFDATTTGTYPTGVAAADGGIVEHWRQTSGAAMQMLYHATTDKIFHRRMAASAWGTWRENLTLNQGATEGDTIYRGASAWTRLAKGTAAQILRMNAGATAPEWAAAGLPAWTFLTPQATTSGTNKDFTGIPATASEIIIYFQGNSLTTADDILVRLGDAGGIEATGYAQLSAVTAVGGDAGTTAFAVYVGVSTSASYGSMTLTLTDAAAFTWSQSHVVAHTTTRTVVGGGVKSLSDTLTQIRVTVSGGAWDAGSLVVGYR